jgi:hypothetical protein
MSEFERVVFGAAATWLYSSDYYNYSVHCTPAVDNKTNQTISDCQYRARLRTTRLGGAD